VTALSGAALRALPRLPLSMLTALVTTDRPVGESQAVWAGMAQTATGSPIDTFICVHSRDLDHLFELSLRSYALNFRPKGRLFLVSNDVDALRRELDRAELGAGAELMADDDWLSVKERTLPGWYRQQIIKLRSYQFCETRGFCNLGADTVLLRPVTSDDLVAGGRPILYYNGPRRTSIIAPDFWMDRWYEMVRLDHVARILRVTPTVARRYVDFIFDLFCFDREYLAELNRYLTRLYGAEAYYSLMHELGDSDRKQFGEWTLYSTYLLDCIGAPVEVRSSAATFLRQIRNDRILRRYRFDSKVVHFVDKAMDPAEIVRRIVAAGLPLGRTLGVDHPVVATPMDHLAVDPTVSATGAI
jgi:hypothetical protein